MTDRIRSLTVILDHDIREDDVAVIVQAVKQIRHVDSVKLGTLDNSEIFARIRIKRELIDKLYGVLEDNDE